MLCDKDHSGQVETDVFLKVLPKANNVKLDIIPELSNLFCMFRELGSDGKTQIGMEDWLRFWQQFECKHGTGTTELHIQQIRRWLMNQSSCHQSLSRLIRQVFPLGLLL